MLILDEAYGEMAPEGALPRNRHGSSTGRTSFECVHFQKVTGLRACVAAMRSEQPGNHYASFNKVRNHFGVNKMAQVAALAALKDQAYLETGLR